MKRFRNSIAFEIFIMVMALVVMLPFIANGFSKYYRKIEYLPITELANLKVPYLNLKHLEEKQFKAEFHISEEDYENMSYIITKRKFRFKNLIDTFQRTRIRNETHFPFEQDTTLATRYIETKLNIDEAMEEIIHEKSRYAPYSFLFLEEKGEDRFDKCIIAIDPLRDDNYEIIVARGNRVFYLSYLGNTSKETILDELDRIL